MQTVLFFDSAAAKYGDVAAQGENRDVFAAYGCAPSKSARIPSVGGCVPPPRVMTVLMENKTASPGSVMVRPPITEPLNSS